LLRKAFPVYPDIAKDRRVQGTVTIKATIGADGHVENPEVVDGPMELRAASLDAVRQWIYSPLYVMGKSTPVETEIHVIFSFGG
jgi:TonB family protein